MPSQPFSILRRNIAELERQFLNFEKRGDGRYTRHELTQCRAFITFCHSEVEIYLETMALRAVDRAEKKWQNKGKIINAAAAMVAYRGIKEVSLPDDPTNQAGRNRFSTIIGGAIAAHRASIRRNHGIKRKDIAELYIPLGLDPTQFSETLLIQLDKLGSRRGDHVHQSSKVSLPNIRDPFDDEQKDIHFLLADLEAFDELAQKVR